MKKNFALIFKHTLNYNFVNFKILNLLAVLIISFTIMSCENEGDLKNKRYAEKVKQDSITEAAHDVKENTGYLKKGDSNADVISSVGGTIVDFDGNNYKTVKIGNQVWMAENLNVSHFRNGDEIPEVKDENLWEEASREHEPAWCYYENLNNNGVKYGKLYNWFAVNDQRGLAPIGFKIPNSDDWKILEKYVGNDNKLRAKTGWALPDFDKEKGNWPSGINGNNESGFSILPGGQRGSGQGFVYGGHYSAFWTFGKDVHYVASTYSGFQVAKLADSQKMNNISEGLASKILSSGLSVRCIKN